MEISHSLNGIDLVTVHPDNSRGRRSVAMFGEWARRAGYWGLDFLRGSNVRKHYLDIKNILENGMDPLVLKKQAERLNGILKYATENIPFYKQYQAFGSLESFPVVNKNIIRDHSELFQSPLYQEKNFVNMTTSGSTGTPFSVRHDKNKRDRVYAEMMYMWGKAGYQIGMKYLFLKIRISLSKMVAWARNVQMFEVGKQEADTFEKIRRILKTDHRIRMILCYPSTLGNLAQYLLSCGDCPESFNVNTIIGFGEALPRTTVAKLKKAFDCTVVSLYSDQENGMLAQECAENKEFHVNNASYHIELLKFESDEPAQIGEAGRIVVTDLFNRAMPLIRYDTGDIGIWKKEAECGWHTPVFSYVQGQKTDIVLDTKGKEKSPHAISVLIEPFDKLLQYQFIQEGEKQYTLKLNGPDGLYEDAEFVKIYKDFLGQDAEITVEHTLEIPVLSSGKRKEVVNNFKKVKAKAEVFCDDANPS